MNPTYSVIIPVYNVENYIQECVESVRYQKFDNWEIILVNDGSQDRSAEICEKMCEKDNRIRLISQKNQGVSCARNRGIQEAKGDFLVFLDGDDYWDSVHFLEKLYSKIDYDTIYIPNLVSLYPNSRKITSIVTDDYEKKEYQDRENMIHLFLSQMKVNRWGCVFFVFRRNIIQENGIYFNERCKIGEDGDWVFRGLQKCNSLSVLETVSYVYRVNREGSAMQKKTKEDIISFFNMISTWRDNSANGARKVFLLFANNAMTYVKTFGLYKKNERKELFRALKKSGAYENADTSEARFIRKAINIIGENKFMLVYGSIYKCRVFGSRIKNQILMLI